MKEFIGESSPEESDVIVLGVPLGSKADLALERLRKLNWFVESFDIDHKKDLIKDLKIADVGNIKINKLEDITSKTKEVIDNKKIPLILGGSHQLSLYVLKAFDENVKLIVFDAHGDMYDSFIDEKIAESIEGLDLNEEEGFKNNCTTWLRRYSEIRNPKNIMIIGLRSCDEEGFQYIEDNSIIYFTPNQIRKNIDSVKEKIKEFVKDSSVYISLDIDVFDPSIAPAVDHPEPNGISFHEFTELLKVIKGSKIVGMDFVELKPIEGNEITEFLAVKSIFEILRLIKP
jgi:agmatinase